MNLISRFSTSRRRLAGGIAVGLFLAALFMVAHLAGQNPAGFPDGYPAFLTGTDFAVSCMV